MVANLGESVSKIKEMGVEAEKDGSAKREGGGERSEGKWVAKLGEMTQLREKGSEAKGDG
jgi:hypothetical protein